MKEDKQEILIKKEIETLRKEEQKEWQALSNVGSDVNIIDQIRLSREHTNRRKIIIKRITDMEIMRSHLMEKLFTIKTKVMGNAEIKYLVSHSKHLSDEDIARMIVQKQQRNQERVVESRNSFNRRIEELSSDEYYINHPEELKEEIAIIKRERSEIRDILLSDYKKSIEDLRKLSDKDFI